MYKLAVRLIFAFSITVCWHSVVAGDKSVYLIFDASNSMWGELPDKQRKIAVAKQVLADFDAADFADRDLALRIYGHNRARDCSDTELVVPFADSSQNFSAIRDAVNAVTPRGKTPITQSLKAALNDFGDRQGDILLISDGIETCDIDPCELMGQWQRDGIDIQVHVVGFGLDDVARTAMTCVANTSGGSYFDARTADQFADAIEQANEVVTAGGDELEAVQAGNPQETSRGYYVKIIGRDDSGEKLRFVKGSAVREGEEPFEVNAEFKNRVEPGDYKLELGVTTRSGEIFKPVVTTASVSQPGDTVVEVTVHRPPRVSACYVEGGAAVKVASTISAWQDGKEIFRFRHKDEVFVMLGTYEFRTTPNADNELQQTVEIQEGLDTELVWELTNTVSIYVTYVLSGGEIVKQNTKLWQDGKNVYNLHAHNRKLVRPGIYEVHTDKKLISAVIEEFQVVNEEDRNYEVPIDAGYLLVSFDPEAEYKRNPDRAIVRSQTGPGRRTNVAPDQAVPASPGECRVQVPNNIGEFEDVVVTVVKGETTDVLLSPEGG